LGKHFWELWQHLSLRSQMLLVIVIGSLLPMIAACGLLAFQTAASFHREALVTLDQTVDAVTALTEGATGPQAVPYTFASGRKAPGSPLPDLQALSNEIRAIAIGKTGFPCVIDAQGRIVAGPDFALRDPSVFSFLAGLKGPGAIVLRNGEGRRWMINIGQPIHGLRAVALEKEQDVIDRIHRFCLQMALAVGTLLVLMVWASVFLISAVLTPVQELTEAAEKLKEGAWNTRVRIRRNVEWGALGHAFNDMASQLGDQYLQIEKEVQRRTAQLSLENAERKQAEESLRLKQNELEAMNEASPLGIFATDSQGLCTYANQLLHDIFEGSPILGSGWVTLIHPEDRSAVVEKWQAAVRENRAFESAHRILPRRDRVRWISAKAAPMKGASGIIGYVGTVEDVTENKLVEQRLIAQAELTRALAHARKFEDVHAEVLQLFCEAGHWDLCEVWLIDSRAQKLTLSCMWGAPYLPLQEIDQLQRASSFSSGVGLPGKALNSKEPVWMPDLNVEADSHLKAMAGYGFRHGLAIPMILSTEIIGVITLYARRNIDFDSRLLKVLGTWSSEVVQFIARIDAEKEREAMELELRHAQKMESIGQLAAGIAHEINTPTQFISDNTRFLKDSFQDIGRLMNHYDQLLQQSKKENVSLDIVSKTEAVAREIDIDYLNAEVPKALQQSLDGLERVSRIVRAMKEFSHPGTGEKTLVNLNQAIESTLLVASNEWKYVAEIETHLDPALPVVRCLPGEINQVILNLVVNAAQALAEMLGENSPCKGKISIATGICDEWAEIRIADSGPGIPEKHRARIFDPFFTTKAVGKGTGQGLAIAHAVIVEKHGGTLSFETAEGVGTTFLIRLPMEPGQP